MTGLDQAYLDTLVKAALQEDIGGGDVTTRLTIPETLQAHGVMAARQDGVVAGVDVAREVFRALDPALEFKVVKPDGARVGKNDIVAEVGGSAGSILVGERVALNFLQRMCGIATLTAAFVDRVAHTRARIADTRKTTPGLRRLEKYAVRAGGGTNHRFGLSDGVLIKDNHIIAAGGVTAAVKAAKQFAPHNLKIEVEVSALEQLREAVAAGADAVLLDNMDLDGIRRAVDTAGGKVLLEVSGGVKLDTVAKYAETGVDIISIGALTHSAPALDIGLDFAAR